MKTAILIVIAALVFSDVFVVTCLLRASSAYSRAEERACAAKAREKQKEKNRESNEKTNMCRIV